MMLKQIERKQKIQQEHMRAQAAKAAKTATDPATTTATQTLGVHNCPSGLVARIAAIAKKESKTQGKRITVSEVAVWVLVLGLDQLEQDYGDLE
jgi:FKBP-type peptidyl-prolyl cis-trans isomerase